MCEPYASALSGRGSSSRLNQLIGSSAIVRVAEKRQTRDSLRGALSERSWGAVWIARLSAGAVSSPERSGAYWLGSFVHLDKESSLVVGEVWIEEVDGGEVEETTGVEETSIGQGLVGVTARMGGIEGRGKDIG